MRPTSSARPQSGMKTGYGGPLGGQGVSLNRDLEVAARPTVMREGMKMANTGAPPGTSYGPARQIVDASYCIGILRSKIAELTAEIENLRHEEESIMRGEATLGQIQQKQKTLSEEILSMKNTMFDINFTVERADSQDAETINSQAVKLRKENAEKRKDVDGIFLKVKGIETNTRNYNNQLLQELGALEEKLKNQDVDLYRNVRAEAYQTADNLLNQENELRLLSNRRDILMNSINNDADKKRAMVLTLDIIKKRHMRDEMVKETSISIDEERQNLMRQAKVTSADIDLLQRQVAEAKESINEINKNIATASEEINEYTDDNLHKYHELQKKDAEMQEFIDSYNDKEMEEIRRIQQCEGVIVNLLERISRALILKQQMPQESSAQILEQLAIELNEKENQCKNSKITHQRLEKELDERKSELEKITTLDEKISSELISIANKMQERKQEIEKYTDLDQLRVEIDNRKKSINSRKAYLLKQRDNSKQRIMSLNNDYEQKKQALNQNEIHNSLSVTEQKLRLIWQSSYLLDDFVRLKEKDTQYLATKAECVRMIDECNSILKDTKRYETNLTIIGS